MIQSLYIWLSALLIISCQPFFAEAKGFSIIHSNDLHSHLLGFPPNIDYTPNSTGNDETMGGWARIAGIIKKIKSDCKSPVLVLDAGDFLMGSLFHLLCREKAFELRLMKVMGYDMATLGNHEFDLGPAGLARILDTAHREGQIPQIVLSNAVFSEERQEDDELFRIFRQGIVRPYHVLEKSGIRFGIFGLMGRNAAEVAPFAKPVRFEDPIEAAKRVARDLREKENADVVICLSHCGLSGKKGHSEDEQLAKQVEGIDIIISGHSHTETRKPLVENNITIVQTGAYGRHLGILDMTYAGPGQVSLRDYRLIKINDTIKGDEEVSKLVDSFESLVNQEVLERMDLGFRKIIVETDFSLEKREDESNLGNLIADSIRWYANTIAADPDDPATRISVAVVSNGVIRDKIEKGKTGHIAVCDAFRAIPLGVGFDDEQSMGYPLVAFYLHPSEVKKGLEILTSIYPLKGHDYFLHASGIKFSYNPNRMIFDRVTDIWIGDEEEGYRPLDYSRSNTDLIRVAADIYNATFLKIVGDYTWHILDIVPKDRHGHPIHDLKNVRIDADRDQPGIQEVKEWIGFLHYLQQFQDTDGNKIPKIPEKYRGTLGRQVIEASWNPYHLLKRGTYVTWVTCLVALAILVFLVLFFRWIFMRVRC